MRKDPGIPKSLPFIGKVLEEAHAAKQQAALAKQKNQKIDDVMDETMANEEVKLTDLMQSALDRTKEYTDKTSNIEESNFISIEYSDNSRKTYFKEFRKIIELSDVLLQVLDARNPQGSRSKQVEEMILQSGSNKRLILIVNKMDLVPPDVATQWIKYLRHEFPTIGFKSSVGSKYSYRKPGINQLGQYGKIKAEDCCGGDELIQLLKNYCKNANIKTSINVGVIGFPNVGKSSLINSLKKSKSCLVGSTAGLTKSLQEVYLDKHIKLIDCPGIVFVSKDNTNEQNLDLLMRSCMKIEQVDDPMLYMDALLEKCDKKELMIIYRIHEFDTVSEFLQILSKKYGKVKKGGILDLENTARMVLMDCSSGKIPFYCLPPPRNQENIDSKVVEEWSKEFEIDNLEPSNA